MQIIAYIIIGFIAQLIDGSIGMAYGVSNNTLLRSIGVPAPISSACVHISEIFTTLFSGISHIKLKNFDRKLAKKILFTGVIGGVIGAYILVSYNTVILDVLIDLYLIAMGIVIFVKSYRKDKVKKEYSNGIYALGFVGGLSDAFGGGGWGPIVTSSLLASGHDAKKSIGTVNAVEFLVTIAETTTFLIMLNDFKSYTTIVLGLIIGGVLAAPLGALICKKIPIKILMRYIGVFICVLNIYEVLKHTGVV